MPQNALKMRVLEHLHFLHTAVKTLLYFIFKFPLAIFVKTGYNSIQKISAFAALNYGGLLMYKETIKTTGDKMDKTIAVIQKDLATLRAGRANPQILDKITVDYYGSPTALNQVGNISSPEPRLLVIAPWEPSMITPIEKAIQKSDIGINPSNDGKVIRLLVPELTAERRKDLCKQVKKRIEEGKVAIRSIRRDAMEAVKKMKKDSQITEDDQKNAEKELQKLTDAKIEMIEKVGAAKEKEIMEV